MAAEIPATNEILLATDYSKQFLDALLGNGWEKWGESLGGEKSAELMLQIFGVFNLIALSIICALFIWVTAIAVSGTAHEGTPFGKKYSSLWMPVRFVGAMGALAPIFKGLSLFQVALLACIGWSINLGNYIWDLGVDYFVDNGGQLTSLPPSNNVSEFNIIADGTLESLTMQYYLQNRRDTTITPGGQWNYSENWIGDGGELKYLFNGNAGYIIIECIDQNDSMCQYKRNAVEPAISTLMPVAEKLADPNTPISDIPQTALYDVSQNVNKILLSSMQQYAKDKDSVLSKKLEAFTENTRSYGWFMAGSAYWSISWINQEVRDAMYSGISYNPPDWNESEWYAWSGRLRDHAVQKRVRNYIDSAYSPRRGVVDTTTSPSVTDEEGIGSAIIGTLRHVINNSIFGEILPTAVSLLSKYDPIMAISSLGDCIIYGAYGLFIAFIAASKVSFLGPGEPIISFLLFSVFLPLSLYGITLAYYLPAIPFIRWISAFIGWVILIVESLIAAPLWICAHALPEGEGAAGQHGRRGYLLFLGILIRPPLMVAGFYCAIIIINIIGRIIGEGFLLFYDGASQTKIIGFTGQISMLIILGIIILMVTNRIFSLVHHLPENVTNWIGQQMHSLGEKEDQSSVKGAFVGSTNAVSEGGRGVKNLIKVKKEEDNNSGGKVPPDINERSFRS